MWIKICGIRDVATALSVAQSGADAIGLNFYLPSPRFVAPAVAREIVAALPPGVEPVGLFINHSQEEVREIAIACGLQTLQIHGDEPPEFVAALALDFRVVRSFRIDDDKTGAGMEQVARYLDACRRLGAIPWGCLFDAKVPGSYGGTGHVAPWDMIRREYNKDEWPRLILAGGLRPSNVARAIKAVSPWGVDVASGVESAVACKDSTLVRQFVLNARTPLN
jgi:phosphoribosylanthranilate isomerase